MLSRIVVANGQLAVVLEGSEGSNLMSVNDETVVTIADMGVHACA